jgi:transcriptional regulator with GAF, ATPase, and Fis domain
MEREKAQCLDETGMLIPTSDDNSSNVSPREHIQPLLDAGMTLEEVERALIQAANSDSGGNITAAAQRLGMTRAAYAYRLKKHRL